MHQGLPLQKKAREVAALAAAEREVEQGFPAAKEWARLAQGSLPSADQLPLQAPLVILQILRVKSWDRDMARKQRQGQPPVNTKTWGRKEKTLLRGEEYKSEEQEKQKRKEK